MKIDKIDRRLALKRLALSGTTAAVASASTRLAGALSRKAPDLAVTVLLNEPIVQQWVEDCNAPAGSTTLADERMTNGQLAPFGVRYWGVGNESWGCGGKFIPEDYCREYRRFTEWLPRYGVPLYLIAAGPNGNNTEWTKRFFARWADGAHAPIWWAVPTLRNHAR